MDTLRTSNYQRYFWCFAISKVCLASALKDSDFKIEFFDTFLTLPLKENGVI